MSERFWAKQTPKKFRAGLLIFLIIMRESGMQFRKVSLIHTSIKLL